MRALCGFMSKTKNLAICHSANLPFGISNGYIDDDGRLQRYSIYSILYFIYITIYIKLVIYKTKVSGNTKMQMADWQIGRLGHFDVSVIYLPQKLRTTASKVTDISFRAPRPPCDEAT